MNLYLRLSTYPEVPAMPNELQRCGIKLAILSNGTPSMLQAAVDNSGLRGFFDSVLAVDEIGVFKPHPSAYALAAQRLALPDSRICFLSSNGWDTFSAKAFGFRVVRCNRFGQAPERIPATPDAEISDLSTLAALLGHQDA